MNAIATTRESADSHAAADPAAALDAILSLAREGAVHPALDRLNRFLAGARRAGSESWLRLVGTARAHPLREFVHLDPFTFRCFSKPRGYPGDAGALDYVLRRRELAVRAADPLAEIHHYTTHGALARALLWRRDLVASAADEIAGRASEPIRFFAAACGHLRECDRMRSLKEGRVAKIVAFDMDAENLEGVRRDYANEPIAAHQGSVRQLVEGRHLFADMHLVHGGALLEGLTQAQAAELARALFALLRPGGTLILANLLEGLPDAGYVEAYMDWRITYRTPQSMEALASDIDSGAIDAITYVQDSDATIGAIAVTRR